MSINLRHKRSRILSTMSKSHTVHIGALLVCVCPLPLLYHDPLQAPKFAIANFATSYPFKIVIF